MAQKTDYVKMAHEYAAIMADVKELERKAAPLKEALIAHAEAMDQPHLDLDAVTIERREMLKTAFDKKKLNGKMFDLLLKALPAAVKVDVKLPKDVEPDTDVFSLLDDIGYSEKTMVAYAIRLAV